MSCHYPAHPSDRGHYGACTAWEKEVRDDYDDVEICVEEMQDWQVGIRLLSTL